jgi:hypothetical protein
MGKMGGAYRVLVGRPDVNKPTGIYGRIILKRISRSGKGIDWIDLAQDGERRRAVVNAEMNVRVE